MSVSNRPIENNSNLLNYTLGMVNFIVCECFSYFPIAVIRHHDQSSLLLEIIRGLQFQRARIHEHNSREHGSRQADMVLKQWLEAHIFLYKQKAERTNWEWYRILRPQTLPQLSHLLIFSRQFHQLETKY